MHEIVGRIAALRAEWKDNIALQCFDEAYFDTLGDAEKARFLDCLASGIANPDSEMGCYACHPHDYDLFRPFFARALACRHNVPETAVHVNDWRLETVSGLPEDGRLDLARLGLPPLSMRVRVGRNLRDYPLPARMRRQDRIDLEERMQRAFASLRADPDLGGAYHSLTPGHPDEIDAEAYRRLVDAHVMFKNMDDDPYLRAAGIASDWPHGRGCYVSEDRRFIIWVGEEDCLRIMCMERGTKLNAVFDRLKRALERIDSLDGLDFAYSQDYGVVTSCPTNLGTGMRASVHIPLPNLTADGTARRVKDVAGPLGLSVRGLGGEHTPIGADGTVDISPSARFCITEAQIIAALYRGMERLKAAEDAAG